MPTYAFICDQCGHEFEELVAMGKSAPCPKCKSAKVSKQLTAPAAVGGGSSSGPAPMGGGAKCNPGCGCH